MNKVDLATLFLEVLKIVDLIDDYSSQEDIKRVKETIREVEENGELLFKLHYFPVVQNLPKHLKVAEFELKAYNSISYIIIEKFRYWDNLRAYTTIYEAPSLTKLIVGISGLILNHFGEWEHLPLLLEQMQGDPLVIYGVKTFLNGEGGSENDTT